MKIAILSVSNEGKKVSSKLKLFSDEDPTIIRVDTFHKNINENINNIFNSNYDVIIGVMATGILIRNIANKIKDKTTDPGIISIDEKGKHVISLLGGHLGRANEVSQKIAKILNAEAIITTATDINNHIGIDILANKYYWEIVNKKEILHFNKGILENKIIKIYINTSLNDKVEYINDLRNYLENKDNNSLKVFDIKNNESSIENNELLLENIKNNDYNIIATFNDAKMFFTPRKIVVGIGAKANVSKERIENGIQIAMNNLNLPIERIDYIATAEIKENENGILEAVKNINKPLKIVSIVEIKEFKSLEVSNSEFVQKQFDIPGVSEPSALIIAKKESKHGSKLIHRKIAIDGVTVAVAVSK